MADTKLQNFQMNFEMDSNDFVLYPHDGLYWWHQRASCPMDVHRMTDIEKSTNQWKTSRPVTFLWIVLSTLVTLTCGAGFVHDEWFVRENGKRGRVEDWPMLTYDRNTLLYTLGMYSVCTRDIQPTEKITCHEFELDLFPSATWQSSCFLYGSGCILQGCGLLAVLLSMVIQRPPSIRRCVAHFVSHVHVLAGLLQTTSLFLFPVVLDTPTGRSHCADQCRVGWAYVAATAGTLLTFYCPFLAYFSFYSQGRHA